MIIEKHCSYRRNPLPRVRNWEVSTDEGKNRLYLTLEGRLSVEEVASAADAVIEASGALDPGFDQVNDISGFKPVTLRHSNTSNGANAASSRTVSPRPGGWCQSRRPDRCSSTAPARTNKSTPSSSRSNRPRNCLTNGATRWVRTGPTRRRVRRCGRGRARQPAGEREALRPQSHGPRVSPTAASSGGMRHQGRSRVRAR